MRVAEPIHFRIDFDGPNGCWVWVGANNGRGYGEIRRAGKKHYVHRWMYEHVRGPIPDGLQLDHLCRNPSCCNPGHLEAVPGVENCRRGNGTLLTAEQVAAIRTNGDLTPLHLAEKYGVSRVTIYGILKGRSWRAAA